VGRTGPVTRIALLQFFGIGLVGAGLAWVLGYPGWEILYLGLALSASSTLVVVRHLQQRQQLFEPFGRIVIGVLLLQDVFVLLFLVGLTFFGSWIGLGIGYGSTLLLGAVALILHRYIIPWIATQIKLDDESLLLLALALLFGFGGAAVLMNVPFLVGAFLAGFSLSAFPMNGLVRGMLQSLHSFFLSLFFVSIGLLITAPGWTGVLHGLLFAIVLVASTVLLVSWICSRNGLSSRASLESGLLLAQTSEFSLLLALIGLQRADISQELFSTIVLITVGTMTLTPYLARDRVTNLLMRWYPKRHSALPEETPFQNHILVLGYGRAGSEITKTLVEHGHTVVVVDDDAGVMKQLEGKEKIIGFRGDGSDPNVLDRVWAKKARMVVCTMRRSHYSNAVLRYLQGTEVPVMVRTFDPLHAEVVREAGGIPIVTSEATVENLTRWMELQDSRTSS